MRGLKPEDIKHLLPLRDAQIIQIGVGEYQVNFDLHKGGTIAVEGRCELIDPSGKLVDAWDRGTRSREFRFLDLLGRVITDVAIDTQKSFVVTLDDSSRLRIVDNSDQYESFAVGGMYV